MVTWAPKLLAEFVAISFSHAYHRVQSTGSGVVAGGQVTPLQGWFLWLLC